MAETSDALSAGPGRPSRGRYGSDLMVEVLRESGIRYIALNPGASYRGLHDSLVNFGQGEPPEIILCTHEEIAVALVNGYTRATGEPMATGLHNMIGLLHASMAIFNAWCDRTPILNLGDGGPQDATLRRSTDWVHTALVQGNLVRDFVKYDDQPYSLESVSEALLRAYRIATTEPKGPVYVCLDAHLQEQQISAPLLVPDARLYRASGGQCDVGVFEPVVPRGSWLGSASAPEKPAYGSDRIRPEGEAVTQNSAGATHAPAVRQSRGHPAGRSCGPGAAARLGYGRRVPRPLRSAHGTAVSSTHRGSPEPPPDTGVLAASCERTHAQRRWDQSRPARWCSGLRRCPGADRPAAEPQGRRGHTPPDGFPA